MTVSYTDKVATSKLGNFLRLLIRWKGSIYKLMWKEFMIFVILFYTLNMIYRFALPDDGRRIFEKVALYCEKYNNLIPVAFVLGFYVSIVIDRWWTQINMIPWPTRMALFVTASVQGLDERGRMMRRTIMRYLCLSFVITMSCISPPVKKRFPTFQHMTDAGFMLPNEQKIIEEISTPFNKYFVPLAWATSLVGRARKENRIKDDFSVKTLNDEINAFRGQLGGLFLYDWITIPLVYTQVVTLAVYTFFLSCIMGRQIVGNPNDPNDTSVVDIYVPVFTFLQFFFYMGWLKVAESLVCPFGEDDDDFEVNRVIDENLKMSYLVVDEMHQEHPELIKDQYWDTTQFDVPYTIATANLMPQVEPFIGSAMGISVPRREAQFVELESIKEENEDNAKEPTQKIGLLRRKGSGNRKRTNSVRSGQDGLVKDTSQQASQAGSPSKSILSGMSEIDVKGNPVSDSAKHRETSVFLELEEQTGIINL